MLDLPQTALRNTTANFARAQRILLVDDKAVIRGLIARAFDNHTDLKVLATAANGEVAVSTLKREPADVANAGTCSTVMPLGEIGLAAQRLAVRGRAI